MNQHGLTLPLPKIFLSIALTLATQQVSASSTITSNNSFGSGDYSLIDNNGNFISGGGYGTSGGGVDFYGGEFDSLYGSSGTPNNSSGYAAGDGDAAVDIYTNEHYFSGTSGAVAKILDPNNQLSSIQVDGESIIDFSFSITTPHTYTLTGSMTTSGTGRTNIIFDSNIFTEADGTFSIIGTLAAGDYLFTAESIAALSAPGTSNANFDFALQLNNVSTVPLPAAFWLFASGLMGLFGFINISRRKNS